MKNETIINGMRNLFLKIKNNIYAKIGVILSLIFILAFLILMICVKYFVSYSFLEKKFSEITGLKLEFVKPETTFNLKFNLNTKAEEINIYSKDKTIKFFSVKNPTISFKPIGFLFNRAYFKTFNASNMQLKLRRDKNGNFDIVQNLNNDLNKYFNKKIVLTRLNADIENIDLFFDDELEIKSSVKINLKDTNIKLSKRKKELNFSQNGTVETKIDNIEQVANLNIALNSKYPANNVNFDDLNLNIELQRLNLYIFKDLVKNYISNDIEKTSGYLDLTIKTQNKKQKVDLKIIKPEFVLKSGKTISPYKENVEIAGFLDFFKDKIVFDDLKIKGKNLNILSNGELTPFNKKQKINLKVKIDDTQINSLTPFIPDNAIFYRPKGIPTLKKANFHGILNGDLNIKYFPLDIQGNLKVQNVHIPNYPKPYKQNDVNAIFMKDTVRIYTRVYTPQNEYVLIDGVSKLDNSLWGKYSVKSTQKIDLAFARLYLVPIQQIIGFNIGPVPIMDITGYGNIDISTKGTLDDAQIFGSFNAYNATARIEGLDAKLTNGSATLLFDDKDLIFKEIKGKIDDADFLLTGKGNTKGEVKLNVKIDNAKTSKILKIFNNSLISKPYLKLTKEIVAASGDFNGDINLDGKILDYENPAFFENLKPNGNISLKENKIILSNGLDFDKISGMLNFGQMQSAKFGFNLNNTKFNFEFSVKDNLEKILSNKEFPVNVNIFSNKISSKDILKSISKIKFKNEIQNKILKEISDVNFYSKLNLDLQAQASLNGINYDSLKHNGYLIGLNSSDVKDIKFNSGLIKFVNNKILFDDLNILYKDGKIKTNGSVTNLLNNPNGDLIVAIKDIQLDKLDKIIPKIKVQNAKINSGRLIFKNNNLKVDSLSINYSDMPIFLNANLRDIYNSRAFDSDFSTILNEKSADDIINPYLVTPLKITYEIPLKGSFSGNNDVYSLDFSATLPKGSDISFGGANLGDLNHKREITGKVNVDNDVAKIHNLKLIKYIANQNHKINPIVALKMDGAIIQKNDLMEYENFKVLTNTPINVRILNLIFKKSLLKKGNFDCNIALNGDIKLPKVNGKVNLYDLDIPLYDTKVDNVKINISDKFIDGEILAKNNKQNDVKIKLHALNKLFLPFVVKDIIVLSNKLDINDILLSIVPSEIITDITPKNEITIKPEDVIIEKGSFDFKEVQYQNIVAQNLKGNLNYKNEVLNLKNIMFNIAQGSIVANGKYDVKSTDLKLEAVMDDCDSNILTKDFLKLPNQIFGKMDGKISLSGKKLHTFEGVNSIKSDINFSIDNGKMPKLGSLEYLLRAGNLFKNGLLGLSLNNLIEVLTPYKTGEFEKISGNLTVNNGEIEKLNILSKGKNLSLFLDGNYSLLENFADIQIYGKLSQNITNALGAIGNASINQLVETITQVKRNKNDKDVKLQQALDKIPSIENETTIPRYFRARVLGDINKDNYIKNFSWI